MRPQPDGNLPAAALERLSGIGEWMGRYGESVYGTDASGIPEQSWGVTTRKDNAIYMHLIEPLEGVGSVVLPLDAKVKSVKAMTDGASLKYRQSDGRLTVELEKTPADVDYIIEVQLKD